MKTYPLKLVPVTKKIIWGGNYIAENFDIGDKGESIAEAWMMTVRPDGVNIIDNGEYKGMDLSEYIEKTGAKAVYGDFEAFPLLIKLIDANDRLSVQVHPDDEYAKNNGLDAGKTEMWYVVDAQPGAQLVSGLSVDKAPTYEEIEARNSNGTLSDMLNYVDVKKGDCFFIPAGLVHAIGKGIVIAEIQQNSNTTFRLYDYDRTDKDGNKRELHIEKAAQVIKTSFDEKAIVNKVIKSTDDETVTTLCDCSLFAAIKHEICNNAVSDFNGGTMLNILCLDGNGYIEYDGEEYELKKGFTYLIPADMGNFKVTGKSDKLEIIVSYAK